jgi:hypothetical protein
VAPWRRWLPFAAAAVATALLAGGVGLGADRLLTPRADPAPQLHTVSQASLERLGLSLGPASQPPYCGIADAAVGQGWLRPGSAGCAIDRDVAESAAAQGSATRVLESVLATVSSTRNAVIGRNHLAWMVVLQQSPTLNCQQTGARMTCAGVTGSAFGWNQLAVVDAYGGGVLSTLRLSPGRRQQGPAPGATLGT